MRRQLEILITLIILLHSSSATRLPPQWCTRLAKLCTEFNDEQPSPPAVMMNLVDHFSGVTSPVMYLFPAVILWSPLEQYKHILNLTCPKCTVIGQLNTCLHSIGWRNGAGGERSEPRKIYGSNGVCLLVGRVYQCSIGHEVVGYHPGVITQIPSCFVPFRLWHITGFTLELVDIVMSLVTAGMNITGIRNFLYKKQVSMYYCRLQLYETVKLYLTVSEPFPTLDTWKQFFSSFQPSAHALSGCFLSEFWIRDNMYVKCMQNTTIDENEAWLSLDHTFSSTRNIGFSRIGDNRWITQYEALFCVLNSKGQIVTWRLTQGLSFSEIEPDLIALRDRLLLQGKTLKEFYIDNCCTWRKKIQNVFGDSLRVYLDIFHAVKRFCEKIPKRHPLRQECIKQWKNVFRDSTDQGETRHLPTPSPAILESNLDKFLLLWKESEYDGKKLLSSAALKEIENIRVHIQKGCLSGIKPGRGTNRNENLHKDLNKIMSCSKYGVELAYALLTITFFSHNERMAATSEQRSEHPIQFYACSNLEVTTNERFGLKFSKEYTPLCNKSVTHISNTDGTCTFKSLDITSCSYKTLYQRIMDTPVPPTGHLREVVDFVDDAGQVSVNSTENEDLEEDECQSVPIALLKKILIQALSWLYVHKSISCLSETAEIKLDEIPFMPSMASNLCMFMGGKEQGSVHEERLDRLLKSWKQIKQEVPRDGNCLFYSVAHNIITQIERGNSELEQLLVNNGINSKGNQSEIAGALRKAVVNEWLKNSQYYQSFITENQLKIQANEFLQDGVYESDVGDLAISALSNLLQTPFVLFTSMADHPIYVQYPTSSPVVNANPIYLAYLHYGPGHYDAVVPEGEHDSALTSATSCTCGRKNIKGSACSFSLKQYACRCPCYNSKMPCTKHCKCKGCTNTFGVRSIAMECAVSHGRKRQLHEAQSIPLQGKRSAKFMEDVGETAKIGGLSKTEQLVICSIVQILASDNWEELHDIDENEVCKIYHHILELIEILKLDLVLFNREKEKIKTFLKNISYRWDLFRQKNMVIKIVKK